MDVRGKILPAFHDNPLLFGLYYCPIHFRVQPSPGFHMKMSVEAVRNKYLAVQAPRGSAKSTVLTFLHTLHGVCLRRYHFVVLVQNTFAKAANTLEAIKEELKNNERVKRDFPLVFKKDSEGEIIVSYPGTYWSCRVLCKGADQIGSIRGEKHIAWRPDLLLVDDLEDDEMVKSPERRKNIQSLFDDVLEYALDKAGKVIVVGTILHDDCLVAKLVDPQQYKMYRKLFYRARHVNTVSGERESIWPERWTVEDLDKLEAEKPESFAKELQGDPSSGIYEDFLRSDFRYWKVVGREVALLDESGAVARRFSLDAVKPAIACDLAWEEKRASDSSVIMPGYLTPDNDILIDDYISKKGMRPDEIEQCLFDMEKRMKALTGSNVVIGFEKAKLEKVVKWLLGQAMRKRQHYLWLKDISWDKDKITRIVTRLSNRYRQHTIYHKRGMGELEQQLIRIRSTAHDDCADAAQMLAVLLENPKRPKKKLSEDDGFERLRKFAIESKKPLINKKRYSSFLNPLYRGRSSVVPSSVCPI